LRNAAHAVEQAVFGVDVEMSEILLHQPNYSTCVEDPKRAISDCPKFLHN
jgi:hypothetical protein